MLPQINKRHPLSLNGFLLVPVVVAASLLFLVLSCSSRKKENSTQPPVPVQEHWEDKAARMVASQIVARGVSDGRVIDAMQHTPRHLFVPDDVKEFAYNDYPLPIGYGQTISQPYIVALMTELLELSGDEVVLEIGTGSGYQAAILSRLVKNCYSMEVVRELAEGSGKLLKELGYQNVEVKWGDGYQGWPEKAPFDAIIITAAPEEVPEKLVEQLKTGGRMVVPVGKFYQNLLLITKKEEGYRQKNIIPVRFVPMVHPGKE